MDIDNLQQNMNTRVVFKEPRGMVRWLQLFFAIIAFSTVVDFYTTVGIGITCPATAPSTTPAPTTTNASSTSTSSTTSTTSTTLAPLTQAQVVYPKLVVVYPFDFSQQVVTNTCPGYNYTYQHLSSLNASPQFFVMTGVLSLIYAALSLVVYLLFSSTYESIPVWPIADLIVTAILCLFWFIASSSFSSGVSLLKTTAVYENLEQAVCPNQFKNIPGALCVAAESPSWKSLNVGLVSGFTSFFLWGAGLWFVYKETHFHTPRDTFGPR